MRGYFNEIFPCDNKEKFWSNSVGEACARGVVIKLEGETITKFSWVLGWKKKTKKSPKNYGKEWE